MAGTSVLSSHPLAARDLSQRKCLCRGIFKPFQSRTHPRSQICRAQQQGDLQLVRREETNDGAILFVFGDEAAVTAQQKQEEEQVPPAEEHAPTEEEVPQPVQRPKASYEAARAEQVAESAPEPEPAAPEPALVAPEPAIAAEEEQQHAAQEEEEEEPVAANGSLVPDFAEPEMDPDEMLSDEDAPDLQDEIAKTLTSLRVADLKAMCKERGITGFSKHRKSQLVRVLKDAMLVESE